MHARTPRSAIALLLLALLAGCGETAGETHEFSDDVEACKTNLRALHGALRAYTLREGAPPAADGDAFLLALVSSGDLASDEEIGRLLVCPGVAPETSGLAADPAERARAWRASDAFGPDATTYAGRDQLRAPLPRFPGPGTEAVAACDNRHGPNHDGVTNVLLADGSVLSLELAYEKELGNLPEGADRTPVGPSSPIELLQALGGD